MPDEHPSALSADVAPPPHDVNSVYNQQAPSRSGDRYHYVRTARLCLEMLLPGSNLQKVVVEGTSSDDASTGGEDVIDLALYYGEVDGEACRILYRQFKHSLTAVETPMTSSDLIKTLMGYAARFPSAVAAEEASECGLTHEFEFETNRPIASNVITAISELRSGAPSREARYFKNKLPLSDDQLRAFAGRLRLLPEVPPLTTQTELLSQDSRSYLPDIDRDVPMRLVEMVANKAAKPDQADLVITRNDILRMMDCSEHDLLPAPTELRLPENFIERPFFKDLAEAIIASDCPIVLVAEGGMGKSVAATALQNYLPAGSISILYDCFANGSYRQISRLRHEPRHGFVQIANELAFQGLCDPLIPSAKATADAYARAFEARIKQAAASVTGAQQGSVILLIIDAADNAEIAARENGDTASFAKSLLRLDWPNGVRVVLTTRPERKHLLDPPPFPRTSEIIVQSFSERETARYFKKKFPDASNASSSTFHRLTSANPRLQHKALEGGSSPDQVLERLGPLPRTVQEAMDAILDQALLAAKDAAGSEERLTIDRMCGALAMLRPFIPLEVLSTVSGASNAFVKTFSSELGKALVINDDAVQFIDEPTEHWFQNKFEPTMEDAQFLAVKLREMSRTSPYASIALPRLLLVSGQLDELVEMSLFDRDLPEQEDVFRRELQLQRLRISVQAALQAKRFSDVASLAFKAAGLAAAEGRQLSVISSNPDLASSFLEPAQAADLVANRKIGGGRWFGSDNAHQAALFAGYEQFRGDAYSRLYTANNWLQDHMDRRTENGQRATDHVSFDEEISAMAWAIFQLDGADRCARFLRSWSPRSISFEFGSVVALRLADLGRVDDMKTLLQAAGNDIFLASAVIHEMLKVNIVPDKRDLLRSMKMLSSVHVDLGVQNQKYRRILAEHQYLPAIVSVCIAATRSRAMPPRRISKLLSRYLPKSLDHEISGHWHAPYGVLDSLMKGFALRAAINGRPLTVSRLLKRKSKKSGSDRDGERRYAAESLVPWYRLWANAVLKRITSIDLEVKVQEASKEASHPNAYHYERVNEKSDQLVVLRASIFGFLSVPKNRWGDTESWYRHKPSQVLRPTAVCHIVRLLSQNPEMHSFALGLTHHATEDYANWRVGAEAAVDMYISIARAVFHISFDEAKALFGLATIEAKKLGEENHDRWGAILSIGQHATKEPMECPQLAYKLARFAEPTYDQMGKYSYLDWERTMRVLTRLSPQSVLAISSRWADRDFGNIDREVHIVLDELWQMGKVEATLVASMFPAHGVGLQEALVALLKAGRGDIAQKLVGNYVYTSDLNLEQLNSLQNLSKKTGLNAGWLEGAITAAELREVDLYPTPKQTKIKQNKLDWRKLLFNLDLTVAEDIATAKDIIDSHRTPGRENVWAVLLPFVPAGREAAFLKSFQSLKGFGYWEVRQLLPQIPDSWYQRAAFKPALKALILRMLDVNPFCPGLWGWHERNPFGEMANLSGLSEEECARHMLTVVGGYDQSLSSAEYFYLSAVAARAIEPADAAKVLSSVLQQMEFTIETDDGDGPWKPSLLPVGSATDAALGYLWSSLGSPSPSRRWRATHAVRRVLEWCDGTHLLKLVAFAKEGHLQAFQDSRLPFYHFHALEWLLIAMERVSIGEPGRLVEAKEWLLGIAAPGERHVANRGRAAKILLAMQNAKKIKLKRCETERLSTVNEDRTRKGVLPSVSNDINAQDEKDRLFFNYESRDELLRPLCNAFSLSEAEAELRVVPLMRQMALQSDGTVLVNDPRRKLGIIRSDDYLSARSKRLDSWSGYLSHHGVFTLTGMLLDGISPGSSERDYFTPSSFVENATGTAGEGGKWRADRRRSTPQDTLVMSEADKKTWFEEMKKSEAANYQETANGKVLWGRWTSLLGQLRRSVDVRTALINSEAAPSLIRALRAAKNPNDYDIPTAENYSEINLDGYVLKGWVHDVDLTGDIDVSDPWAADIRNSLLMPAKFIADRLGLLRHDSELRWYGRSPECALELQCWAEGMRYGERETNNGDRLVATNDFIEEVVQKTGMVFISKVQVRHNYGRGSELWDNKNCCERTWIELLGSTNG